MEFAEYFPVWDKLTEAQRQRVAGVVEYRTVKKAPTSTTAAPNAWAL